MSLQSLDSVMESVRHEVLSASASLNVSLIEEFIHFAEDPAGQNASFPPEPDAFLQRVATLLESGADPNITWCKCTYTNGTVRRTRHGILSFGNIVKFIGKETTFDLKKSINLSEDMEPLDSQHNPLIECLRRRSKRAVTLLFRHGARLIRTPLAPLSYQEGVTNPWPNRLVEVHERLIAEVLATHRGSDDIFQDWILHCLREALELGLKTFHYPRYSPLQNDKIYESRWQRGSIPTEVIDCVERCPALLAGLSQGERDLSTAISVDSVPLYRRFKTGNFEFHLERDGGSALLNLAAESQAADMINILIKDGINVDVEDHIGLTPLYVAVYYSKFRSVQALLDAGASVDFEPTIPFDTPGWERRFPKQLLCSSSSDKKQEQESAFNVFRANHWSVLHVAGWRGDLDIIRLLLTHGAHDYALDRLWRTPRDVLEEYYSSSSVTSQRSSTNLKEQLRQADLPPKRFVLGIKRLRSDNTHGEYDAQVVWRKAGTHTVESLRKTHECVISDTVLGQTTCTHNNPQGLVDTATAHTTKSALACEFCLLVHDQASVQCLRSGSSMNLTLSEDRETLTHQLWVTLDNVDCCHTVEKLSSK
jgi:ankyrin repeat protein